MRRARPVSTPHPAAAAVPSAPPSRPPPRCSPWPRAPAAAAPQGLANSSGQVGRGLMDTTGTNITGQIPALENRPRFNEDGKEVAHLYIPFWLFKQQAAGQ